MQKEQKNGFGIVGIIIIIAAVAILGGGYWYWQSRIEVSLPPSSDQSPVIAEGDFTGWKTYRNEKYGFEVRYPENWTVEENKIYPFGVRILPESRLRDVMIIMDPVNVGRESVFDERKTGLASCTIKTILFVGRETKDCKAESIFGYSRYMRIQDIRGIKWEKNNEISLNAPAEYKNLITIFDQILSTFKFIK